MGQRCPGAPHQHGTREEPRTFAPVDLLAADAEIAGGTVMHTLAVLADTFSADEQEEPLLAGGAAILLRADDTACAVAPQTSAHCQPDQGGAWGKRRERWSNHMCEQVRWSHWDIN